MSTTDDIGNSIFLAPASKATYRLSARLRTCTTVPPRLISPMIAICDCIERPSAAEHNAMKLASVND